MNSSEGQAIFVYYLHELFSYKFIKILGAFLMSGLSFIFGGFGSEVLALLVLMILDFVFGFLVAFVKKDIDSGEMRRGIFKFILFGVAIITGHLLDVVLSASGLGKLLQDNVINFKALIVAYLAINEGISILEHLSFFGVPLPRKIFLRLKKAQKNL